MAKLEENFNQKFLDLNSNFQVLNQKVDGLSSNYQVLNQKV